MSTATSTPYGQELSIINRNWLLRSWSISSSVASSRYAAASTSRLLMTSPAPFTICAATAPMPAITSCSSAGIAAAGYRRRRDLRDVRRQVAHPLQVGHHPQRGDQHPELVRDRSLPGHQVEDPVLDPLAARVQLDVGGDDLLGLP